MATLAITIPAGSNASDLLRRLSFQLRQCAEQVPDGVSTGAATVLTIDNAPANGVASVTLSGPYTSNTLFV